MEQRGRYNRGWRKLFVLQLHKIYFLSNNITVKVKVKISPLQALEALRVVRG
jgi:hypothetical protein